MKKLIRWGMIGCGAVTEVKSAPAYALVEGFELSAVMGRRAEKVQDYAQRHGIETVFTQADELIFSDQVDAVYIATPPDSHLFYARKVAEAGKPCCIEKPLAPCQADGLGICRAFEVRDLPLFVAYYRRSLPRFNEIKKILDAGELGKIRQVSWNLSKPASAVDLAGTTNWRTDKTIAPGGYFDDLASHGLDLFAYLLGDFAEVKGIGENQQGLYSALDALSACWRHTSGVLGMGSWNFGCSTRADRVEIQGSLGRITFSIFDETPIRILGVQGEREMVIENPAHIQLYHVQNMAKQLFHDTPHPSTGVSAAHTSWVMDKIIGVSCKTDDFTR
jgi:predicted dehydrogenase